MLSDGFLWGFACGAITVAGILYGLALWLEHRLDEDDERATGRKEP